MNKIDRYKILIRNAKEYGFITSQKDLAYKMGYKDEVSLSQIINGKTREPKDFVQRLCAIIPNLNADWILTGAGSMLLNSDAPPPMQTNIGDGVAVNNSQFRDINSTAALQKLADEIAEQRKMYAALLEKRDEELARKDEQIDKLLGLLAAK